MNEVKLDFDLSVKIANLIKVRLYLCYINAMNGMSHAMHLKIGEVFYVEGWAKSKQSTTPDYPQGHAWLRIGDKIIDPTFCIYGNEFRAEYYPAIEYSEIEIQNLERENRNKNGNDKLKFPLCENYKLTKEQKNLFSIQKSHIESSIES